MSARRDAARALDDAGEAWVAEHDDERGIPCFRAGQLEVARSASSYEDVLYLLGEEAVTFLLPPSLAQTQGDY